MAYFTDYGEIINLNIGKCFYLNIYMCFCVLLIKRTEGELCYAHVYFKIARAILLKKYLPDVCEKLKN